MIHIVSGFLRSYTTMMMHCLEAGGLSPVFDAERDQWAVEHGEVNPGNSLREITNETYQRMLAEPREFDGKLVKVLSKYGYLKLPEWPCRVVLMTRHPEEIRQSFHRVFGKPLLFGDEEGNQVPLTDQLYEHIIKGAMADLVVQGIDFTLVRGDNAVENPLTVFGYLKENGWPIDVEKAAAVVKVECRHVVV